MPPLRPSALAAAALLALSACSTAPELAPPAGSTGVTATPLGGTGASGIASAVTVPDQAFLTHAAYGGLAEVALGEMAQMQASSPGVREFGQRMVADHSQANAELVALAESKGMTPPTAPDPGRQAIAAALSSLEGAEFDRQYLQQQIAEHRMAMALYDAAASSASDPEIRAFAIRWLPALQDHALLARSLMGEPVAGLIR